MMRFGSFSSRSFIGENRALMRGISGERKEGLDGHLKSRRHDYQRRGVAGVKPTSSPRKRAPHIPPSSPAKAGDPVFRDSSDRIEKSRRTESPGHPRR